jgi:hypothetical protein
VPLPTIALSASLGGGGWGGVEPSIKIRNTCVPLVGHLKGSTEGGLGTSGDSGNARYGPRKGVPGSNPIPGRGKKNKGSRGSAQKTKARSTKDDKPEGVGWVVW